MKKRLLYIFPVILLLVLASCSKNKKSTFNKFAEAVYQSEQVLTSYKELDELYFDNNLVYSYATDLKITRGEVISTSVTQTEKKLPNTGELDLITTTTSYRTVGDKKYVLVNGTEVESSYTIPTYFLTFVVSEDYFEDGFSLENPNKTNNYSLKGNVKNEYVGSLFLNKSLPNITNLRIEIEVIESKLTKFIATYKSANSFDGVISITYSYNE
ncbi:MAG: hypothetical protein ACI35S_04295 [Anaeroplasma sp.]